MRKIKVSVSTGYIGCTSEDVIEVEDNATEDEINRLALDHMFDSMIDYGWSEEDKTEES